ncbi:MAG: PAS domain-containing protein [Natronospirillum sp.]|uniref:sensor histidine kinase n=1 Tax=Natronospirillum sp. TaxID=2812955 RepID=UPI0025F5ACDB|nr:ATP-binding protein [Natronospirillum sp.]MCH8550383.1 PAS domain-containing protein [Natronospirillum sp.]
MAFWPTHFERRDALLTVVLAALAVAGNYFPVPLMFGVDLLLGSIFIYVLLLQYGLGVALLIAVPAYLTTWLIWNHPYSAILLILELLVLAALKARYTRRELPLLMALLWVPWLAMLSLLFYRVTLDLPWPDTLLITFKQGINSIINATFAVAVSLGCAAMLPNRQKVMVRVHEVLFYLPSLLSVVALITILFTVSQIQLTHLQQGFRQQLLQSRELLTDQTERNITSLINDVRGFNQRCVAANQPLSAIADCLSGVLAFSLWDQVFISSSGDPGWQVDHDGVVSMVAEDVSLLPDQGTPEDGFRLDELGRLVYFQQFPDNPDGWLIAQLDVSSRASQLWVTERSPSLRHSWWHDGQLIVASRAPLSERLNDQDYPNSTPSGDVMHVMPSDSQLNRVQQWAQSVYVLESPLESIGLPLPGTLRLEFSPRQEQLRLYQMYVIVLASALGFLLLALLFSQSLARWLERPVNQLIGTARAIPGRINLPPDAWPWPAERPIHELNDLQSSLREMSRLLHEQYRSDLDDRFKLEKQVVLRTRELSQARDYLGSILASMDGVLWSGELKRSHLNIRLVSASVLKLTGYPQEDWIRKPQIMLREVVEEDQHRVRQEVRQMLKRRRGELEFGFQHGDGSRCQLRVRYWVVYNTAGWPQRIDGLATDISAWHAAQQQIRQQETMLNLQARRAAMGDMVSNIAHQWRQPLNSLQLIHANLRDAQDYGDLTPQFLSQSLDKSGELIQRMNQTVRDFLNFFRPDRAAAPFDLGHCVAEAVRIMQATLDDSPIRIDVELRADVRVSGFANELLQVLLVILQNSREAIERRGVVDGLVRVELVTDDDRAEIRVSDNGGGVPVDMLERIFDPYFTTRAEGTGIGLYMARSIVEIQMNGALMATNVGPEKAPAGASFIILLPLEGTDG